MQFSHTRWEAFDRFLSLGFPPPADNDWMCPEVSPLAAHYFTIAAEAPNPPCHLSRQLQAAGPFAAELVFINGYYSPRSSQVGPLPERVRVERLAPLLNEDPDAVLSYLALVAPNDRLSLAALNTALFVDGACIRIPDRTILDRPIHVRFISTGEADSLPAMSHPRLLVLLGAESAATVIESWAGPEGIQYFTNTVTELVIGPGARLDRYLVQQESTNSYHVSTTGVIGAREARCVSHCLSLGGGFVRSDVVVTLDGEGGQFTEKRLSAVDGARLVEDHASINHTAPRCTSIRTVAAVLAARARVAHERSVVVRSSATDTHARQSNRTLLLSDHAQSRSTANLSDVAGTTKYGQRTVVRRLDDAAASYASFRGLSDAAARHATVLAFAGQVLDDVPEGSLASTLQGLVREEMKRLLTSAIPE